MKTTNFEISKKLKEIGFEAEFNFHYKATDHVNLYDSGYEDYKEENTPTYDFETLFNILPKTYNKKQLKIWVWYNSVYIIYQDSDGFIEESITTKKQKNETLADTAGRLLIKLFEAGIINFKK